MEKYTCQFLDHAQNGGELRNMCAFPDGYADVPSTGYIPINDDAFINNKSLEIYDNLKQRNEQLWSEMNAIGPIEKNGSSTFFHGCICHWHQSCETSKAEHRGVSSLDRYEMIMKHKSANAAAGFEVVRVWECELLKMKEECTVRTQQNGEEEF